MGRTSVAAGRKEGEAGDEMMLMQDEASEATEERREWMVEDGDHTSVSPWLQRVRRERKSAIKY